MIDALRRKVRAMLARRLQVPEVPVGLERLRAQGFEPRLIADVGAHEGEFARLCMTLWPEAALVAFEPRPEAAVVLRRHALGHRAGFRVYECLLGAAESDAIVLHEAQTASSVLAERHDPGHACGSYPMRTLDAILREDHGGAAPDLLKLDVQGYELEVLRGAERSLERIRLVLAEVNLLDIHAGVPLLAEMVAWLAQRGFVAFDICGLTRRPLDQALWQADMVFVRVMDPLRADKRWNR